MYCMSAFITESYLYICYLHCASTAEWQAKMYHKQTQWNSTSVPHILSGVYAAHMKMVQCCYNDLISVWVGVEILLEIQKSGC